MDYDFIEIGTSDFDTLIQNTKNQIGLSIEPIKFYLDNLPNNPHVIKVNCAISNIDGITDVFWVDPKDIEEHGMFSYLRGCNSINHPNEIILNELKSFNLESLLKKSECITATWKTIVNRYDIKSVNLLKIDTEGHDCHIINNILDDCEGVLPKKIIFEANKLSDPILINKTIGRLIEHEYVLISKDDTDVILERL